MSDTRNQYPYRTIPNVPVGQIVNDEKGMSSEFESFLIQLILYLQTYVSNNGFVPPSLSTSEIALLTDALNGTIVYNSTTGKLMGKVSGTFTNII